MLSGGCYNISCRFRARRKLLKVGVTKKKRPVSPNFALCAICLRRASYPTKPFTPYRVFVAICEKTDFYLEQVAKRFVFLTFNRQIASRIKLEIYHIIYQKILKSRLVYGMIKVPNKNLISLL